MVLYWQYRVRVIILESEIVILSNYSMFSNLLNAINV